MKIINEKKTACFFPYAGRSKRGVDLQPQQESPPIPIDRIKDSRLMRDLENGRVSLVLTTQDKVVLRGLIPDEMLESSNEDEVVVVVKAPEQAPEQAPEPPTPPKPEEPTPDFVAVRRQPSNIKVDPIKEEIAETIAITTDAGQEQLTENLQNSDNSGVVDAINELKDGEEPEVQEELEVIATAAETAGSIEEQPKNKSGSTPSTYGSYGRAKLISTLLQRGMEVDPTKMTLKSMRQTLVEDDKRRS